MQHSMVKCPAKLMNHEEMLLFLALLYCLMISRVGAMRITLDVEHRLENESFQTAGMLEGEISPEGSFQGPFIFKRNPLSESEKLKLKDLALKNGQYSLRLKSNFKDSKSDYVLASVPAKCLLTSNAKESLLLELTDDNRIISIDYSVNCQLNQVSNYDDSVRAIDLKAVKVTHRYPLLAAKLSIKDVLAKQENAEHSKEGGKPGSPAKPQKTWIQQNWLFIIGGALIMFQIMGAVVEPNAGQPNQGQVRR